MKTMKLIVLQLFLLIPVIIADLAFCDTAIFSNVTGNWYSINSSLESWPDAKLSAEAAGGYLVSITSGEENKWISDTFGIVYNGDYYWLGGNDIASEGIWEWANGEAWGYTNWHSGEPNNFGGV